MSTKTPWWIRVPVLFFLIFGLMEFFIDSGDKPAIIEYPITQFFMLLVLMILIAIELILASIENIMFQTLSEEGKERYLEAKDKKFEWTWAKNLMKRLTKSRSIEREGEIVLDHNYDGIRELDNVLPPWWVYLFYATIVFAVVYLVRFHIIGEYDQELEYEQEVAAAQLAIEEYKRIQEFPDNWKLSGNLRNQYKQIGNAVPVSLGKAIGKLIINHAQKKQIKQIEGFKYSRYLNTSDKDWVNSFKKDKQQSFNF